MQPPSLEMLGTLGLLDRRNLAWPAGGGSALLAPAPLGVGDRFLVDSHHDSTSLARPGVLRKQHEEWLERLSVKESRLGAPSTVYDGDGTFRCGA